MISLDTNIVVRFLAADEPFQTELATECVSKGAFVSHGVLMETEWVLRGRFGWSRKRINEALRQFLSLETVQAGAPAELDWALDRHLIGADWADMLHLVASRHHDGFATFDKALRKEAGNDAPVPVIAIP